MDKYTAITGNETVLDTRDIDVRIEYLERDDDDATDDERAELAYLIELRDSALIADWHYGATLIHDDHFEEYAQEMAEDIGAINRDAAWPYMHIDWAAAADALQEDYFSVEVNGNTYWVR